MTFRTDIDPEEGARPLLLLGLTVVFIAVLLIASGGGGEAKPGGSSRGRAPAGYVPLVPGAPVDSVTGSPIKDAPPVTIIDDVRETLHRLPLDRNNPPDTPPPPKRKPG